MSEYSPEPLNGLKRTDYCGDLRLKDAGRKVTLMGWVHRRRDLGGLIFIELRDRSGIVQCVFDQNVSNELFEKASVLRNEFTVAIIGQADQRKVPAKNADLATKDIEVNVEELHILNTCKPLPIQVSEEQVADEGLRMKYRYIDLRKPRMARNIALRHKITKSVRDYFDSKGFYEIETPILVASTPEGARDYLVPSRVNPGKFYALPQSPQLYKQMLMVSGLDRYFQIARCFRDEDLRADRQPEFTQIDVEMSFVERDDVLEMIEGLIHHLFTDTLGIEVPAKLQRMPYSEALEKYGSDKPDLRVDMVIQDVTETIGKTGFVILDNALEQGQKIKGFVVKGKGGSTRKEQDKYKDFGQNASLPGLFFIARHEGNVKSSLLKYLGEEKALTLCEKMGAEDGDLVVLAAGESRPLSVALGKVRLDIANSLNLLNPQEYKFLWVVDFPMYSWNEEENRLEAEHHPFTSPLPSDADKLESAPLEVRAAAYDLVLNGCELASGSVRIHQREMQERIFKGIGLSIEEAEAKFGFLLTAFGYGAPPHAGIALGLDRLTAIIAGETSIREVIAFPKNTNGIDLLSGAPVTVTDEQMKLVHLKYDLD
ncbi:aspartate--tRNA ligase [bacterium]|nr:aspartate--tRNA ligase [bacterium]